ncbi:hypothetical protein BGZ46_002037, partial [Entomortierella lignicola]
MGLPGWFPFLRKKGYSPSSLTQSEIAAIHTNKRRVDVLGSCFRVLRGIYSNNSQDKAHDLILEELSKFGSPSVLVLYIDGQQADEKKQTFTVRNATRKKAAIRCSKSLDTLESWIQSNSRVRKRHFTDVISNLSSAFYLSLTCRKDLVDFLRGAGFDARLCLTEADVAIAKDFQDSDVVISSDSDMFAYASITRVWRPISNGLFLEYKTSDLLGTLALSRAQLTALAVVSKNDYGKNIFSLGPETNYGLIKSIVGQDPKSIVSAYLVDPRVISKNADNKTFDVALRVFVAFEQTPIDDDISSEYCVLYDELRIRFSSLIDLHSELKKRRQQEEPQNRVPNDEIMRLRHSRKFNRFQSVESPALSSSQRRQSTSSTQLSEQLALTPQNDAQVSPSLSEPIGHPPLPRTRIPRHRLRYSFKARKGAKQCPPPAKMKQFVLKPYKEPSVEPTEPSDNSHNKPKAQPKAQSKAKAKAKSAPTLKLEVMRSMAYQHPISSLYIGTLSANVKRAVSNQPTLQQAVTLCIQEASREAARIKRKGQILIGTYIERLESIGKDLSNTDRAILDLLSRRLVIKDAERLDTDDEEIESNSNDDAELEGKVKAGKGAEQLAFLWAFLKSIYSGNPPNNVGMGQKVNAFIYRLCQLGLYTQPRSLSEINERMPFTPTDLVRSVATDLKAQLERIYRRGSYDLYNKLKETQKDVQIREDISAVENFILLNKMSNNSRRIVPITKSEQPFVGFSERELVGFFFKQGGKLKQRVLELASSDGVCTSIADAQNWVGGKEPGYLIKQFIANIDPDNLTSRQRGKVGRRAAIKLLPLTELQNHLDDLNDTEFRPTAYTRKGYVSKGSLRTDSFRLQLLCFKLRELQCVRYMRLPTDRLPPRITSTVGGIDYFLREIRHVVESKDDVARLWPGVNPSDIKILTLDAGQAFVVGAYAHLPHDISETSKGKAVVWNEPSATNTLVSPTTTRALMKDAAETPLLEAPTALSLPTDRKTIHHNLAINQKAVLQPVFKYRRWLEDEKQKIPKNGSDSIAHIESRLPPLRGLGSSVLNYANDLELIENRLLDFYHGKNNRFKKHILDMTNAKQAEYQAIASRLLGIFGGSIGRPRDDTNPVVIG